MIIKKKTVLLQKFYKNKIRVMLRRKDFLT